MAEVVAAVARYAFQTTGTFWTVSALNRWKTGVQPDLLYDPTDTIADCCASHANPSEMFRKDRIKEADRLTKHIVLTKTRFPGR